MALLWHCGTETLWHCGTEALRHCGRHQADCPEQNNGRATWSLCKTTQLSNPIEKSFYEEPAFLRFLSQKSSKYSSHQRHVFIRIYETVHIFRMTRIFKSHHHICRVSCYRCAFTTLADDLALPLPPFPLPTSLPPLFLLLTSLSPCTPRTGKALQGADISLAFFGNPQCCPRRKQCDALAPFSKHSTALATSLHKDTFHFKTDVTSVFIF